MLYQCSLVFTAVWLALRELGELGALTGAACIIADGVPSHIGLLLSHDPATKMPISRKRPSLGWLNRTPYCAPASVP